MMGLRRYKCCWLPPARDVTTTYLDTFRLAGLQSILAEQFALIRTIREQLRQFTQEAAVLVDIEFDNTEIAIIVDGCHNFLAQYRLAHINFRVRFCEQ